MKLTKQSIRSRRAFTLLELCVCLCILGVLAGLMAVPVKKMLDAHRLTACAGAIERELRKAQLLALSYRTDCALEFFKRSGKLCMRLSTDEPIKRLDQSALSLKGVSSLEWEGRKMRLPFRLAIRASGRIDPAGALDVRSSEEHVRIDLTRPLLIRVSR